MTQPSSLSTTLGFRLSPFHDLYNTPVLLFADRPRLDQLDPVTHLTEILLIVRFQLGHPTHELSIERMRDEPVHRNDHGLVHLVTDDVSEPLPSLLHVTSHPLHFLPLPVGAALVMACWRRAVFTRARSCRVCRIRIGFSILPVAS